MLEIEYLFVYGTLMSNNGNKMSSFLSENSQFVGKGVFNGVLFIVDYYPGVIPSQNPEDTVYGEVYLLDNPKYVIDKLDEYEGFSAKFLRTTEYLREKRVIKLYNGALIEAWIYLYNKPTKNLKRIESGNFLDMK